MTLKRPIAALTLLAFVSVASAANEIGLYFDEAGTQSNLYLDPSEGEFRVIQLYVVLKNPEAGVSAFNYQHAGSFHRPGIFVMQSTFLDGYCHGFAHCDPSYWYVTAHACTCTQGDIIVLQTLTLFVSMSFSTELFNIGPTGCVVWAGFSYLPCGCGTDECAIPFELAADAPATLNWGVVANESQTFSALKALYQ